MPAIIDLARRLTTPLLPDDYLGLIDPMLVTTSLRARIVSVTPEVPNVVTLRLRTSQPMSAAVAGQHVRVGVDLEGVRTWRTFSLSSAVPGGKFRDFTITIKASGNGGVSDHLVSRARRGDVVYLGEPTGDFTMTTATTKTAGTTEPLGNPTSSVQSADRLLMIAGGSGVTPLLSMIRTITASPIQPLTTLIYSAPQLDDLIALGELSNLSEQTDWFTFHPIASRTDGRLDAESLTQLEPQWRAARTFACGPAGMVDWIHDFWRQSKNSDRLQTESYAATDLSFTADTTSSVSFRRSGKLIVAEPGTTLLEAGERAGVLMPSGCRSGICHTCVVPLREGSVRNLRNGAIHDSPDELVQTCITEAACDVVLDV